ncbi:MAG: M14 family zinc carboxypeptidase [Bacteroidota bacterium]
MRGSFLTGLLALALMPGLTCLEAQQPAALRMQVAIPLHSLENPSAALRELPVDRMSGDTVYMETPTPEAFSIASRYPRAILTPLALQLTDSDMANSLDEAKTFSKYPTLDHYIRMMQDFASDYPAICRLDTIGFSIQNKPVLVLKISDRVDEEEGELRFFYSSSIHGDEILGYVLLLHLADTLLRSYGNSAYLTTLLDETEVWINPLANPDGAYTISDTTLLYSQRYNSNNKDLNRDFPDPVAGDAFDDISGRQKETVDMMSFMMKYRFNMSANLHGGAEVVNYPWDHKYALHPDDNWLIFISREYADEVHAENTYYMDDFPDGITNGADWYIVYGGRQDYSTFYLGGRELTLELSNTKLLPSSLLLQYWDYNDLSLINLMQQSRYGIHGKVTGPAGQALTALISIPGYDDASSVVSSDNADGHFLRYLKEGTYDLEIKADGFKDTILRNIPVSDYQPTVLDIRLDSLSLGSGKQAFAELTFYPNPADDRMIISLSRPAQLSFIGSDGRIIREVHLDSGESVVELQDFASGVYILRISEPGGCDFRRLVISH